MDIDIYSVTEKKSTVDIGANISVLVLVSEEDFKVHEALLTKVLGAIKTLDQDQYYVYQLAKDDKTELSSWVTAGVQRILIFGINPKNLGFNIDVKAYKFFQTETYSLIVSHSLRKLSENKNYKLALWNSLQAEFGI